MLNIPESVKKKWIEENEKQLIIWLKNGSKYETLISEDDIEFESISLKEALMDANSDFIGCISSMFKFTVNNLKYRNIEGKQIEVRLRVKNDITGTEIWFFNGFVKDCKMKSNKSSVEITCYDALYKLSNADVTDWFYNWALSHYKATYFEFRKDLFQMLGITQKSATLPNDNEIIETLTNDGYSSDVDETKTIYALDLIKSICQINGAFGIINRTGLFEYRYIKLNDYDAIYLPYTLPFMPQPNESGEGTDKPVFYQYYKTCNYEEYSMHKLTRVYVRQSEDGKAGYYGSDKSYKYIVQGNHLTLKTSKERKSQIAQNIYNKISDMEIFPFDATLDGLPWVEVGDTVRLYVYDYEKSEKTGDDHYKIQSFIVMNRTLSGYLGMNDNVSATVSKAQKKYVSDMNVREYVSNEELSDKIDNTNTRVDNLNDTVDDYGDDIGWLQRNYWDVQSVATLPANPDPRTIYLIQGTVG